MRNLLFFLLQLWVLSATCQPSTPQKVASGHLPVIIADTKGAMHLVYGQDSTIFYAMAKSQTASFNAPSKVATLPNLVAGAKRGPQLAITDQFIVITAVNRQGDIYAYSLNRATNQWSPAVQVNDVPEIAKEGFQAIAGSGNGLFHAAWLDLRDDKKNKIVGASSRDGGAPGPKIRLSIDRLMAPFASAVRFHLPLKIMMYMYSSAIGWAVHVTYI